MDRPVGEKKAWYLYFFRGEGEGESIDPPFYYISKNYSLCQYSSQYYVMAVSSVCLLIYIREHDFWAGKEECNKPAIPRLAQLQSVKL